MTAFDSYVRQSRVGVQRRGFLKAAAATGVVGAVSRLGIAQDESEPRKYLIVHADDAGMSHSVNLGTIQAIEQGQVSSASIMVPCPWFLEFAEYCRKHPAGDYGIHLTLNSEWTFYRWGPVASRDRVPSLVDPDGFLWDNVSQVVANVKASEAEFELRAQIDRARRSGVVLSHLDTHMGALLSRPDLLEVYVRLGLDYELPVLFIGSSHPAASEYPALAERGEPLRRQLLAAGLPVLDGVAQFYNGQSHEARRERYLDFIRSLPPGVHELIIHCGYDNRELQAITSSAARRDGDRRIFTDPAVAALIAEQGIQVISWKEFRTLSNV